MDKTRQSLPAERPAAGPIRPPRRVRGWISIEVGVGIAFVAIMLFFLGPKINELFSGGRQEQAFAQVNDVILAAERYRAINGDYEDISIEELRDNGYGLFQLANDGDDDNVYGEDVTVVGADGNANADITYVFNDAESCQQVLARIDDNGQITDEECDDDNQLTFTLD